MMERQKRPLRNRILITAALLFMMTVAPSNAFAVKFCWNGWVGHGWANPLNWDNDGGEYYYFPPGNGDEVVFAAVRCWTSPERPYRYTVTKNNDIVPKLNSIDIMYGYELSGSGGVEIQDYLDVDISPYRCASVNDSVKIDLGLGFPDGVVAMSIGETCGYDVIIGGEMYGDGGISKWGSGTLLLNNMPKSLTGGTSVAEGTLFVDSSMILSAITVSNNAQLRGVGTVGDVTIKSNGTLYPGPDLTSCGDLTSTGNVIFTGQGTPKYKVLINNNDAGKLIALGSVNLGDGITNLKPVFATTPETGQAFTIIQSANSITGEFANLPEGATGNAGNITYAITYQGGSGQDVVLSITGTATFTETIIYPQEQIYEYGDVPLALLEVTALDGSEPPCGEARIILEAERIDNQFDLGTCTLRPDAEDPTKSICAIEVVRRVEFYSHTESYPPSAGTYWLSARYPGCADWGPSSSESASSFTIEKVDPTTELSASANPISAGDTVTFTFKVNQVPLTHLPPSANWVFWKVNGDAPPVGCEGSHLDEDTGLAFCTTTFNEPGLYTISAEYIGDANHSAVEIDLQGGLVVNDPPSITSSDSATFIAGTAADFTVTTSGYPLPSLSVSGTLPDGVTFTDNGDGTATLGGTPAPVGAKGDYSLTITAANGVSPDADQDFTLRVEKPEIRIMCNSRIIQNGDIIPRTVDGTDFGSVPVNGYSKNITYTIGNIGNVDLLFSDSPAVKLGGANPGNFRVINNPTSSIAAGSSVSFTVAFDPSATGLRSATVSIGNNDADENPYYFAIQGTGLSSTAIDLISFTATDEGGYVELAWETASEIETAGFHLWRSSPGVPEYVRTTTSLISAEGGLLQGAEYAYEDNDTASGGTYYYVLEDIDYHGVSTFHEPVSVILAGEEILLLSPIDNAKLPTELPPIFEWDGKHIGKFKLQFSRKPDFTSRIITLPKRKKANRWITDTAYTPGKKEWQLIRRLGRKGKTIYWRVYGLDGQGSKIISNTQWFVIERP
jgi:autotransporter-associated beta strand protein